MLTKWFPLGILFICRIIFKHAKIPPFRHKTLLACSEETDLIVLYDLRLQHQKILQNPLVGYLNINSITNKICESYVCS